MSNDTNLTGVWNGLYSYITEPNIPQSLFVAVIMDTNNHLSGTIHETLNHADGTSDGTNAHLAGNHAGGSVNFVEAYDGTAGFTHEVHYEGTIKTGDDEIEGQWRIDSRWGAYYGRFLMIRARPKGEVVAVRVAESLDVQTP